MMSQVPTRHFRVLGVRIDTPTVDYAISYLIKHSKSKKPAIYITQPYVEFIDRAQQDAEVVRLLNEAFWNLPDGVALQWAIYWQKLPHKGFSSLVKSLAQIIFNAEYIEKYLPELFHSSSSTWKLLEAAAAAGLRVTIVGAPKHNDISDTVRFIKRRIPNLKLTAYSSRKKGGAYKSLGQLVRKLPDQLAQADMTLVATGFPLQEKIMNHLATKLSHGVLIGEGGTFDYKTFGGKIARAPKFVQDINLEWLWRLVREPKRFKRQLAIPRFIWRVYKTGGR